MKKKLLAWLMCGAVTLSLAACGESESKTESNGTPNGTDTAQADTADTEENVAEGKKEGSETSAEGGETLTFMIMAQNASLVYYERMIAAYEEASGNKLDILGMDSDNFDTIATSKFATGDIPDIFVHHNDAVLSNYDVANNFYYMNDQAWADELTEDAYKNALDEEGNLLGLPFGENSISGFYYNKTLLDQLGLQAATTQEEFDALCQAIKDAGHTPLCFPLGNCFWMYQFALDPIFTDNPELLEQLNKNEITYADIPQITDMCQWIKDAADKGWFEDTYMSDGWDDLSEIMGSGEAVILPIWDTWFITDFDESYGYTMDDFGVMPVFLNTIAQGSYEGGNVLMIMANKNSEKLDIVLDFLKFCASEETYNAAFDGVPTVSIYKNQTTNIQTHMVTEASDSLNACLRPSITATRVIGYTQADTATAIQELIMGNVDVKGCIALMDEARTATAKALGTEGF